MSSSCETPMKPVQAVPPVEKVQWGELPTAMNRAEALRAAIEEGRRAGYADGYREGQEKARVEAEAARRAFEADVHVLLAALADAAVHVQSVRVQTATEIEDELAAAAVDLAECVLGRALTAAESPGADALARALRLAPTGELVTARINPVDAELAADVPPGVTVIADPSVQRGGCIAEAGDWRIDAQLSTALARVRKALLG